VLTAAFGLQSARQSKLFLAKVQAKDVQLPLSSSPPQRCGAVFQLAKFNWALLNLFLLITYRALLLSDKAFINAALCLLLLLVNCPGKTQTECRPQTRLCHAPERPRPRSTKHSDLGLSLSLSLGSVGFTGNVIRVEALGGQHTVVPDIAAPAPAPPTIVCSFVQIRDAQCSVTRL